MKPVLQSTTKIAGAARAANFSKSLLICGFDCLNIWYPAIVKRAGPPARYHMAKMMPLAEINNAFELMKRGESIRGVVTF
jgi:hypothetical protein